MPKKIKLLFSYLGCVFALISSDAQSADWFVGNVSGDSAYRQTTVWSGTPRALNGQSHDFSSFYESQRVTFNLQGDLFVPLTKSIYVVAPFRLDSGYKSDLYNAEPLLTTGIGVGWAKDRLAVSLIGRNLFSYGGKVTERPCVDSYDRKFHCGTALPWTDVAPLLATDSDLAPSFMLRINWRF